MDPVVHFEMPYENGERMSKFYTTAFNWQMQMLGEDMGKYVLASTTESEENGRPKMPGAIHGGFFPKSASSSQYPSFVISVKNITESIKKIKDAGGKIIGEPVEIPGVGQFVAFIDTEGNRVSILQPLPMNG